MPMRKRTIKKAKKPLIVATIIAWCMVLLAMSVFAASVGGPISLSDASLSKLYATYTGSQATGNTANGKAEAIGGTNSITATVKSSHNKYVFVHTYKASNLTITLKNGYSSSATLKFDYEAKNPSGTVTVDSTTSNQGTFVKELAAGEEVTITISSSEDESGHSAGVELKITGLSLTQKDVMATTTFIPGEHGSYTVNGKAVDGEISHKQKSTDEYSLNAQAEAGYTFFGWKNKTTRSYLSTKNPVSIGIASDCTIQPVFIPEDWAQFGVGSEVFYDLNEANAFALNLKQATKTIVLIKSGSLPVGQYTISSGVTLLIPYSSSTEVHTTSPSNSGTEDIKSNRLAYRTLTVPSGAQINVHGELNVDGQISKNKSLPTGQYGLITLESGANIHLYGEVDGNGDKGNLYCWGYINGGGMVIAHSNASVYESFQLTGWRGGNASQKLVREADEKRVFPLNQYYIQNVEAALQFNYGAKEYVYASVVVLSNIQKYITTEFISTDTSNTGMFRLKPGCTFTKKYVPETDRMIFEVDGDFTISTMEMDFEIVKLQTKQYELPINSNFSVNILSGTTTIASTQGVALLPGAEFTVAHNAKFVAASSMYVYDRDEWIAGNYASSNAKLLVVGYSPSYGVKTKRTDADLVDAAINVNGTIKISGKLYTTIGGANIFSSEGTGKIIFESETTATTTTNQVIQTGNKVSGYASINCTSAKLRNANDAKGNEQFTLTAGAQAGWTYTYLTEALSANSEKYKDMWYLFKVTYVDVASGKSEVKYITTDSDSFNVPGADASSILKAETKKGTATCSFEGSTLNVSRINAGEDRECTIWITNTKQEFTIKFDGNEPESGKLSGSTNSMTVPMSETTVTLPDCGFTATGWKFVGWSLKKDTAASSTELLKTSATQEQLGKPAAGDEVTLYAIWQPDKVYSVTVSWSKGLEYTYIPNEYTWNATEMRYEHTRKAGWIGANDSNPTVTISNGGDKTDVTYGHINAGIQYTPNDAAYNGFTMDFLVDNQSVGKGSATLATKLAPKNSVTTTMKLEGTPFIGMDTGKPITIGTVALTLTTAD